MVYAQPRIRPGKWDAQTSQEFKNTNGLISARRPDGVIVKPEDWLIPGYFKRDKKAIEHEDDSVTSGGFTSLEWSPKS